MLNIDIIVKYCNLSIKSNNELNYDYDLLKHFNILKIDNLKYKFGKKYSH